MTNFAPIVQNKLRSILKLQKFPFRFRNSPLSDTDTSTFPTCPSTGHNEKQIGECKISFSLENFFVALVDITFVNTRGCTRCWLCRNSNIPRGLLKDEEIGCWIVDPGETKTVTSQTDIDITKDVECHAY
jgi:hypothetical protein